MDHTKELSDAIRKLADAIEKSAPQPTYVPYYVPQPAPYYPAPRYPYYQPIWVGTANGVDTYTISATSN